MCKIVIDISVNRFCLLLWLIVMRKVMFFWEEKMIEICFCMKGIMFISIVLEVIDFELDNFEV